MRLVLALALAPLMLLACTGRSPPPAPTPQEETVTPLAVGQRFLSLWQQADYDAMYDLLSSESRAAINRDNFVDRYQAIVEEATITGIDFRIDPRVLEDVTEVPYLATIHTAFFGDIDQANAVPLVAEPEGTPGTDGEGRGPTRWRVQWSPSLIFRDLDDRSLVHFLPLVPRRGTIYDRQGRPLAVTVEVPVGGVVPDYIEDKEAVIAALAGALLMPSEEVRGKVEVDFPSYYFIPVATLPYGMPEETVQIFSDMIDLGVVVQEEAQRIYPYGAAAAHILGFLSEISGEELEELGPSGFQPGDSVGAFGLEQSMEKELAGERGGRLITITPEGALARTIAEKPAKPGLDVHLTVDVDVQLAAEGTLGERVGSLVVMDPRDNSVLALVSFPRFDPNAFIRGISQQEFDQLNSDPHNPFLHRPLLATYPPGSTFKVVTMAAGLEKGGFTPGSTLHCSPVWYGLGPNFPKNNWQSVDRGFLTPAEGLMASCNPVFYEMALALDHLGPDILPEFARAFGFGEVTGIRGLPEAEGIAPGPDWKEENGGEPWYSGDSVNMGIGQGFLAVTPLQIANAYSAIADGGVLRQPLLIRKLASSDGALAQEFTAQEIRPLPASTGTLDAIRQGLTLVTQSPGGTSYRVFLGSSVDAAGKSGTAEDLAFGSDHVFFIAYANRAEPAVLAIAALEEGKSGSSEAGPMVRKILESYVGNLVRVMP
jgi:penicillin-binding protein 2